MTRDLLQKLFTLGVSLIGGATLSARAAVAQIGPLLREREGRVISLVPYAPNVLRVL
jgi:hypothetical protein